MAHLTRTTLLAGSLLTLLAGASDAASDAELLAKAKALNQKQLNLDAHTDVLIDSVPERYWLIDNTRNLSDRELDAIKANGGVVSATPFNAYLVKDPKGPKSTLKDYVDHIDYLVKRIGIDHVGIGSDFNHGSGVVGFDDESEAPNVTAELLRRGYTEAQIAKIWGGNFLRVFREVEAAARKLRTT